MARLAEIVTLLRKDNFLVDKNRGGEEGEEGRKYHLNFFNYFPGSFFSIAGEEKKFVSWRLFNFGHRFLVISFFLFFKKLVE